MFSKLQLWRRGIVARQAGFPPPSHAVTVQKDVAIPMRDGVALAANLYLPQPASDYPTVLIRSPWGRGWRKVPFSLLYDYVAQRFAERGYIVVLQDIRNASQTPATHLVPHENEQQDGGDTLRWVSQQSWFNGKVGLWGASYLGYVQWAALTESVPGIQEVAMIPVTTATRWFSMFHPDGALALDTLFRLQYTSAVAEFPFLKMLGALQKQEKVLTQALATLPLTAAMRMLPPTPGFDFAAVMQKADPADPLWQKIDLHRHLESNHARVHLVAGWYDLFVREQIADYQTLHAQGKQPNLTIGPWHHTDQALGAESIRIALQWFAGQLKGESQQLPVQPVKVYILGANKWHSLASWPPSTQSSHFYLRREGRLSPTPPSESASYAQYAYDPGNPTPTIGGAVLNTKAGQQDNRSIEARGDLLFYTSEPLAAEVTIMGTVTVRLFVTSTIAHSDFFVRLCDVSPDGRSLNVTDGFVRLALTPDAVERRQEIQLELSPIAYRFAQGHHLRLQVASGAFPRYDRNLGSGEPTATGTSMQRAEQRVYHDADAPSQLSLPIYQG